jgi:hypothetical protein
MTKHPLFILLSLLIFTAVDSTKTDGQVKATEANQDGKLLVETDTLNFFHFYYSSQKIIQQLK